MDQADDTSWATTVREACKHCGGEDFQQGCGPRALLMCGCCQSGAAHVECEIGAVGAAPAGDSDWFCTQVSTWYEPQQQDQKLASTQSPYQQVCRNIKLRVSALANRTWECPAHVSGLPCCARTRQSQKRVQTRCCLVRYRFSVEGSELVHACHALSHRLISRDDGACCITNAKPGTRGALLPMHVLFRRLRKSTRLDTKSGLHSGSAGVMELNSCQDLN